MSEQKENNLKHSEEGDPPSNQSSKEAESTNASTIQTDLPPRQPPPAYSPTKDISSTFFDSPLESPLLQEPPSHTRVTTRHFNPPLPVSPSSSIFRKDSKKKNRQSFRSIVQQVVQQQSKAPAGSQSGCAVPFVPVSGSSGFTRFKQLSTRRAPAGRRDLQARRTSSTSELINARRLMKARAMRETSSPIMNEPSVTVAVHQFRGRRESGRTAVLSTPSGAHSPVSPGVKPSSLAVLASSGLVKFPEGSSQISAYIDKTNQGTHASKATDFSTLKAVDREKSAEPESQATQYHNQGPSDDNDHWKRLKDAVLEGEAVSPSNGYSSTPIITYSGTNGYHSSKPIDIRETTGTHDSKIPENTRRKQSYIEGNNNDRSYIGPNGEPDYRRESFQSPGQGRPWLMVEEGKDHPGRRKNSGFFQPIKHLSADPEGPGCCALLLALVSILLIVATLPFSLCLCIKVVQEYERSVIFRLGRLRKGGAKGPGIFFIIPCIDTYRKVDLRTVSFDVPPQEVLSRDSVTVTVDAVVYYRVSNPTMATNNVEDFSHSTHLLAATTLRNVLGTKHLAEILSERETISHVMEQTLDEATDPWGVKVERVEIKDVRLPVQLQRAMAAEAEAAREARAKVIAAEGEKKASKALREASDVISESPSALQLRYLQTLNTISAEKNSTIIFPVPMDVISHFLTKKVD